CRPQARPTRGRFALRRRRWPVTCIDRCGRDRPLNGSACARHPSPTLRIAIAVHTTPRGSRPMAQLPFGLRVAWPHGAIRNHRGGTTRRRRSHRALELEPLEGRALLTTVTVNIVNFAFNPPNPTINVGDTVHWVWQSDVHSTTSVQGSAESWNSGVHNTGFT